VDHVRVEEVIETVLDDSEAVLEVGKGDDDLCVRETFS
jgi:hypothetical protein